MGVIVAIDGPAGSGKSTVAKLLAEKLGFFYLDTGALYRALTLAAIRSGTEITDRRRLVELAKTIRIDFDGNRTYIDGEDVSERIRDEAVTAKVRFLAELPEVREVVRSMERRMVAGRDAVVEGRDITTVVFPDAEVKFYLDASVDERARRRLLELRRRGVDVDFEDVKEAVVRRDRSDSERKVAPLKHAPDALLIDTSSLSIEEVVERLFEECRKLKR